MDKEDKSTDVEMLDAVNVLAEDVDMEQRELAKSVNFRGNT